MLFRSQAGVLIACLLFMRRMAETTNVSVITEEIDLADDTDVKYVGENLSIPKGVQVYEINGPYFFGIANKFEEVMNETGNTPKVRVIRMRKVPFIDSTGVHNLTNMCKISQKMRIPVVLSGVNDDVMNVLMKSGFSNVVGKENICIHIDRKSVV